MKKLAILLSILIVIAIFSALGVLGLEGLALAETKVTVQSNVSGSVVYGQKIELFASFSDKNDYDQVVYTWLKNDTAGGWDMVGTGDTLVLEHTLESGDYKCKVEAKNGEITENYYTSAGCNVRIIPKDIEIVISDRSAVYGEIELPLDYSVDTDKILSGDDLQVVLDREPGILPGVYRIYGSCHNVDYSATFVEGEYLIAKKPLDISFEIEGSAMEDGSFTKISPKIDGILTGDSLNYTLLNAENSLAGRYTAEMIIEDNDCYLYHSSHLTFDYVIYKKFYEISIINVEFIGGILPEATIFTQKIDEIIIPSSEVLLSAMEICPVYFDTNFDGGLCNITYLDIQAEEGYRYYAYYGDGMSELKVDTSQGVVVVEAPHSGKIILTRSKFSTLQIALFWSGLGVALLGIAVATTIVIAKKKHK